MAVATHVSRVSKDYAPHGYSIMEDVVVRFGALAHSGSHNVFVHMPLDSDIYVESAALVFDTAAHANADWNVTVVNNTTSQALTGAAVATGAVAALTPQKLEITANQVVAQNAVLVARFADDSSAANSPTGAVVLRYRRKA